MKKTFVNISLIVVMLVILNACAVVPKTSTTTHYHNVACNTVSPEWDFEVLPIEASNYQCQFEECVYVVLAVPVVSAAVTFPIIVIGNSINFIEKQIRCN